MLRHIVPVSLVLAFGLAAGCDVDRKSGTASVTFHLQTPRGDPIDCTEAGVANIEISVFAQIGDGTPVATGQTTCEVDANGRGTASVDLPAGMYELAQVSFLDDAGDTQSTHSGALAAWQYASVEVIGGGLTQFSPAIVAAFRIQGSAVCGDGTREGNEECDDGNTDDGDGCSASCVSETPHLTVEWTPNDGLTDVACGSIVADTVDITIFEAGTSNLAGEELDLPCTDLSFTFLDFPFGTYDIHVEGWDDTTPLLVADATAFAVDHMSFMGTTVEITIVVP